MTTPIRDIKVGIMKIDVAGEDARHLDQLTRGAADIFERQIERESRLSIESLSLEGPELSPDQGSYQALDFVQIGMNEKTERKLSFLIIVTEVEISAGALSYLFALPSQLTNIAVISTRRLAEADSDDAKDIPRLKNRLAVLMLHCFGRMLNLPHVEAPTNLMSKIVAAEDLDAMTHFTDAQFADMAQRLPDEANDKFARGGRTGFILSQTLANLPRIIRAAVRANPIKIVTKLPTMIATALSVIVIMIFGAETWDFAASVSWSQLTLFVVITFAAGAFLLYRAFSFKPVSARHGELSESAVVTAGATILAVLLTLICMFILFGAIMLGLVHFVFPDALMSTWTTAQDGAQFDDHLRLSAFLASVGVLSGSLGGSADSRSVVRNVLFAPDRT